jgi:DNA polymerase-3 subunit beta
VPTSALSSDPEPTAHNVPLNATVSRDDLLSALEWVAQAIPARPPMQVLLGVLLEVTGGVLRVASFDYECSARAGVLAPGGSGEALVPARTFKDLVRTLRKGSDIVLRAESNRLRLLVGDAEFALPLLPIEDYPALPPLDGDLLFDAGGERLGLLNAATVAAGRDDTLPVLTGVLIESHDGRLHAAATDRYRLSVVPFADAPEQDVKVLVPARTLARVARAWKKAKPGEVEVRYNGGSHGDGLVSFKWGDRALTTRTLEGAFPQYRSLLPDGAPGGTLRGERDLLVEATTQAAVLIPRHGPIALSLDWEARAMRVGTVHNASDTGFASVPVKDVTMVPGKGEQVEKFAVNPSYFKRGLECFAAGEVTIAMQTSVRPIVMTQEGSPLLYLLMPVRLADQ